MLRLAIGKQYCPVTLALDVHSGSINNGDFNCFERFNDWLRVIGDPQTDELDLCQGPGVSVRPGAGINDQISQWARSSHVRSCANVTQTINKRNHDDFENLFHFRNLPLQRSLYGHIFTFI